MKTSAIKALALAIATAGLLVSVATTGLILSSGTAIANPLKCNAKEPLLCRKAIIATLRKAGLNQYFIEDGDIILTADTSSAQYAAIKNTPIGIFVHEYDGATLKTRELTVEDVVGLESADSATKGHHPRYGLNVMTTLATTGSLSQPRPQLVTAQLPGQAQASPIKVTLVIAKGTSGERTIEFVLRKNDMSTALAGMQGLGLLDKDLNLVVGKLDASNRYTVSADQLAKLVGVPVSSLQSGDKTTLEYSLAAATDDDLKRDSLDITRTPTGTAQLVLTKPSGPVKLPTPPLDLLGASKSSATAQEKTLLDASNFIGLFTGSKNTVQDKIQKLGEIKALLSSGTIPGSQEIINQIDQAVASHGSLPTTLTAAQITAIATKLRINILGSSIPGTNAPNGLLMAGREYDPVTWENAQRQSKLQAAINENAKREQAYQQELATYNSFLKKQQQIAQTAPGVGSGGLKFYAIDGTSSYASANDFLKAHGQVDTNSGQVKSFNELTMATPNPNHGGSLGYQHFGGSPEFLTSAGNPTPKPYWVHEYVCQDDTCSAYTAVDAKTLQTSDQGRLFRLDQYSGAVRQRLENLIMNGNLEGADPNGRLVQQIGNRVFIFEPLHKDPATTWQPALLHSYNQAVTGTGPQPSLPADMSGFSVGYQVCGPNGCVGVDEKSGMVGALGVVTQLGAIVEQGNLLQTLQSLGAIGANGQINGIGTDQDGKIVVFTQAPGTSDVIKFTFSRLTSDQVKAAGLRPVSKPVKLVTQNPSAQGSKKAQTFTITVSDKTGGVTGSRFPGVVTEDKVKALMAAGVITQQNGQFIIKGTQNPDGTVTAPVTIDGSQFSFTFHPGVYVGNSNMPLAVTQALNQQQVARFFNPNSAQSIAATSLNPIGQGSNAGNSNPPIVSGNTAAVQQAQQHVAHIHAQRTKAANGAVSSKSPNAQSGQTSGSNTATSNQQGTQTGAANLPSLAQTKGTKKPLSPRSTITFAQNVSPPNTHVDALNVNQFFVTPAAGHQVDLREAPKFVDSDNRQWLCMVSGLGHRIAVNSEGRKTVHGHAETLNFIDPAVRDIPGAKHNTSSNCLIAINHD
jgi:hypothetical protein